MTFVWTIVGMLAMMTTNLGRWQENYRKPVYWLEQAGRMLVGLIWGLIGTQLALLDINPSSWFIWFGIPVVVVHLFDIFVAYVMEPKVVANIVETVVIIVAGVGYLFLVTIYPISIAKSTYELANSYVTIVDTAVPETETSNIGLVSEKTAKRVANPKIAELGNSSKYTLGTFTKQSINGEVVWVTPVEYGDFMRAKGGTSGYFVVDAFDTATEVQVKEDTYYYMPSAIFSKDLKRHVRSEMPTKVLFDEMFQVDDEGNAFWVVPYGYYKYYRFVPVIEGVAIVNPTSGEMTSYSLDEVPAWVDTIIPGDIAEKYGKYYGENEHGLWAQLAPTDQFTLTVWEGDDAWSIVYDEEGSMWYATDTTTLNTDKSMVGYMMINARTCEIKYYPNVTGFNGSGISQNFTQIYKEKTGWSPVEPTLYNIYGTLTWFSTMVDENGSIQAYCLGDTKGNVVGETTMNEALISYKRMLATANLGTQDPTENSDVKTVEGTVKRIIITNGRTKILLDTNQVFVIEETVSNMAQFTQPGDAVKISYLDTQETEYYVVEFVNLTLE